MSASLDEPDRSGGALTAYTQRGLLRIARPFANFMEHEILAPLSVDPVAFWNSLASLLEDLAPRNAALLARRQSLQDQIDAWLEQFRAEGRTPSGTDEESFLSRIGYLEPEPDAFEIAPEKVDPEISCIAGPQLVVPLSNPRYVLNAVNARWGSLYDALYGTDAIPNTGETARSPTYNPTRGAWAIGRGRALLDQTAPLEGGSHRDVAAYQIAGGALVATLKDGSSRSLATPSAFRGYRGEPGRPDSILLRHHDLHIDIILDRKHLIGSRDTAGIADIVLESAITTIVDLEDSVAAVDVADKVELYRIMLSLVYGDLAAGFEKDGRSQVRTLAGNRIYTAPDGDTLGLSGRSLVLFRNVGHLMTTDAVLLADGSEAPEGIIDGVVTAFMAVFEARGMTAFRNSACGSTYVVKPKMHGGREVAFANDLFDALEDLVGIPRNTLKIGVMDEERRTSANLAACIHAVRDRVIFINTGFLDRTGDEIHTHMKAGPVVPKSEMRTQLWFCAYEDRNVATGLSSGFAGKAQIGKGMWATPDRMADMLAAKIAHPRAGANAAWVPSPTAATLHALHYHDIDVRARQSELRGMPAPARAQLLTPPIARDTNWPAARLQAEIDNNCQSILGYVVRWIDQGIGCSKVPDIDNVGMMEDRATLRISSQTLANWLMHGVCPASQIEASFVQMAGVVDAQNADDPGYQPMSHALETNIAFRCARELVFLGARQPNGYTEPLLHAYRRARKAADASLKDSQAT